MFLPARCGLTQQLSFRVGALSAPVQHSSCAARGTHLPWLLCVTCGTFLMCVAGDKHLLWLLVVTFAWLAHGAMSILHCWCFIIVLFVRSVVISANA